MNAAAIHSNAGVRSQCWDLALDALALRVHITRREGGRNEAVEAVKEVEEDASRNRREGNSSWRGRKREGERERSAIRDKVIE